MSCSRVVSAYQSLLMIHFIPGNLLGCPELQAVGCRAPVKPVVEGGVITPHVVISVRVQQLIDGQIASNAYGLPTHQKCHDHNQRDLQKNATSLPSLQYVMPIVQNTAASVYIDKICVQDKLEFWLMLLISCQPCHNKHQTLAHACSSACLCVLQAADTCVKPECKRMFVCDCLVMLVSS
jgi:hypothetical protein